MVTSLSGSLLQPVIVEGDHLVEVLPHLLIEELVVSRLASELDSVPILVFDLFDFSLDRCLLHVWLLLGFLLLIFVDESLLSVEDKAPVW